VNKDIAIKKLNLSERNEFESVELSLGAEAVGIKEGLVVSKDYEHLVNEKEAKVLAVCLRMTLVSKRPLLKGQNTLSTFTVPPGKYANRNPIKIFQQNSSVYACPSDYLVTHAFTIAETTQDYEVFYHLLEEHLGLSREEIEKHAWEGVGKDLEGLERLD
jgi:hypothetical protein